MSKLKIKKMKFIFKNFYKNNNENNFKIVIVILSGRLFGRYIEKIKDNINKNSIYIYIYFF